MKPYPQKPYTDWKQQGQGQYNRPFPLLFDDTLTQLGKMNLLMKLFEMLQNNFITMQDYLDSVLQFIESEYDKNEELFSDLKNTVETFNNRLESAELTSDEALQIAKTLENKINATAKQLENIIIESGTSDAEVVAARTDTVTGNTSPTLGSRLDKMTTNPILRNAFPDNVTLGNEMLTSNMMVALGEGWTGDIASGFTHANGSVENLIIELPFVANQIYQVEINMTNPAVTDNGQSDYWLSLAESPEFETYKGRTGRHVWGIKAISGSYLVVRPWENYSGTINISVKQVTASVLPYNVFRDSSGAITSERRLSKAALKSIYFGNNSGRYANEFAEQNVAFGHDALRDNTSGFWSIGIGQEALRDNTVGSRNVALGRIALAQNITGDRNVAVGSWALTRNTTGRSNIGIGADAAYYNTVGSFNIAIGLVALGGNPDGNNHIALGERVMGGSKGGANNFAAGKMALYYAEGDNNTAIGMQAMYRNMTGKNNLGVGYAAAMMNETGDNNVAIGQQTLYNNTASDNIAIGFRASRMNTTGYNNIALGNESLYNNTNGRGNVALGFKTLHANVEGLHSVAIGHESLMSSTGGNNIGIGFNTLKNNSAGAHNVAIGTSTMASSTTGEENTALGAGALVKIEGSRNVAVGRNAGSNKISGEQNVFIGAAAGSAQNEVGSRNILIGYNVQAPYTLNNDFLNIGDIIKSHMVTRIVEMPKLKLSDLPTTLPEEKGLVWNDEGTLKVS